MNQIVAKGMLEHAGATVNIAEHGQMAIDLLRVSPHRYHLVLMDVQMPIMDGFTATRLIRAELGLTLPVLAITAGVTESERMQCTDAGMNDFIAKPIVAGQMFATIARHLPGRSGDMLALPSPISLQNGGILSFDPHRLLASAQDNPIYRNTIISLLKKIVDNGTAPISEARLAWNDERSTDAARMLHALRGTIGTLGARRFSDATVEIEAAILNNEKDRVEHLFFLLEKELSTTISAVSQWLGEQVSPNTDDNDPSELDMAEIRQLRILLLEKNLDACDLYAKLRPGLAQYKNHVEIDALDRAMDHLDFVEAINCLKAI